MKVTIWLGDKKAVLNTERDKLLFRSPRNSPNYTRGSDYYVHFGKYGLYYYSYNWSLRDETSFPYIELLSGIKTKYQIKAWYRDGFGDDTSTKRILEFFPDFLVEVE